MGLAENAPSFLPVEERREPETQTDLNTYMLLNNLIGMR